MEVFSKPVCEEFGPSGMLAASSTVNAAHLN